MSYFILFICYFFVILQCVQPIEYQQEFVPRNYPTNRIIEKSQRPSRSLIFPNPSTILFIFAISTPLQLDYESIIVSSFLKAIFPLPTNSTTYYPRTNQPKNRWSLYKMLEKITSIYGLGDKECLLRAICEVAHIPFNPNHGILGELVQTFLRPSSSVENYEEYQDREYVAAEKMGHRLTNENCHVLYSGCQRSILDVFSIVTER